MVSSRCLSFLNLVLFCTLFQQNIPNSSAAECLNPTFDVNKKRTINYFFTPVDKIEPDKDICKIVNNSNGLLSIKYRMVSDMKDKDNCKKIETCMKHRLMACEYKFYQKRFDDCNEKLPPMGIDIGKCACAGAADDILTKNYAELTGYGVQNTPTVVVDTNYDPCLTDLSLNGLKTYFCKAYNNALPICKG